MEAVSLDNTSFSDMNLCSSCSKIYGYGTYRGVRRCQNCRCPAVLEDAKKQEKWRWFDFNEIVTLCYCCGSELLRSGSRWPVWFCDYCKQQVMDFNGRHGRTIFPIGRHSLMTGLGLSGDDAQEPEMIEQFVSKTRGLFASSDHLAEWSKSIVSENLSVLGLGSSSKVPLMEYLSRAASLDKSEAFRRMREFFQADDKSTDEKRPSAIEGIQGHTDVVEPGHIEDQSSPHSIYTTDEEIKCVFFSLVIRRDALDEHYRNGSQAFLDKHGGGYNDRLVVNCVMDGGDLDDILTDLLSCEVERDYILFDASFPPNDRAKVAFASSWLQGFALNGEFMVSFIDGG